MRARLATLVAPNQSRLLDDVPISALAGALAAVAREAREGNRSGPEIVQAVAVALVQWVETASDGDADRARETLEALMAVWPGGEG